MKMLRSLIVLFCMAPIANAATQAPDFQISMLAQLSTLKISATPPLKHHFNVDAPMSIEDLGNGKTYKPKEAKKDLIVFRVPGTTAREIKTTLYLCDDANTFCEKHIVSARWDGRTIGAIPTITPSKSVAKSATADASPGHTPAPAGSMDKYGFIVNAPKQALEQAARENKPLIIDFFGIWCPPCNMLDQEVFSSKEFRNASAQFVKLKVDADSEYSWALKEKYKVGGYPTVIFTSSSGEELSRIVGFRPKNDFVADVKSAWEARNEPYSVLKARADKNDAKAARRIGLIHLERKEYDKAVEYLSKSPDARDALLSAKLALVENDENQKQSLLETAVTEFSDSPQTLSRRLDLADLYESKKEIDKKKSQLTALVNQAEALAKAPHKLKGYDLMLSDVYVMMADAREKLEDKTGAQKTWMKAAAEYRRRVKNPNDRGNNLELAYCLAKAGKFADAEALYSRLEKIFPREFTFFYNHAYVAFDVAKNPTKAEPLAENALKYSYGDNKLRAALLVAKVRAARGNKDGALKMVNETLEQTKAPSDPHNRTHRYIKNLKSFKDTIAST